MKIKYLRLKNWLLISLGSLLGIQVGCSKISTAEYGCPERYYRAKGTVVNEEGDPIPGIGVQKTRDWENRGGEWAYVDTTDADGRFDVWTNYPDSNNFSTVSFFDIDGEENGSYRDTTVAVSFDGVPLRGGDGNWNEGTATKEITVTLHRIDK